MRALRISANTSSPWDRLLGMTPEDDDGMPGSEQIGDQNFWEDFRKKIVYTIERFLASAEESRRLTFIGRLSRGMAGITLSVRKDQVVVSGHKLDPIPDALMSEAEHFTATQVHEALSTFLSGMTVFIEGSDGEMLLRWDPILPEVFAHGWDSE